MRTLYYNPIEIPNKVRIVSKCFGLEIEYSTDESADMPVYLDELFNLAKCDSFEEVAVFFTAHEEAYIRKSRTAPKEYIEGWFSLKGVKNGGGYLNDKECL